MDSIKLCARKGEAVRQAIELGEIAHIETASEELTDEFLLLVVYLSAADNISSPLPYRLCRLNQPIMSPPNWFSTPRSTLLSSIGAHASRSTACSSTGILF
jgi:hypothetical protein